MEAKVIHTALMKYLAENPEVKDIFRQVEIRLFFEMGYSVDAVCDECSTDRNQFFAVIARRPTSDVANHLTNLHLVLAGEDYRLTPHNEFAAEVVAFVEDLFRIGDIRKRSRCRTYVDARMVVAKVLIAKGYGWTEIASVLNVDRSSVYHYVNTSIDMIPKLLRLYHATVERFKDALVE